MVICSFFQYLADGENLQGIAVPSCFACSSCRISRLSMKGYREFVSSTLLLHVHVDARSTRKKLNAHAGFEHINGFMVKELLPR